MNQQPSRELRAVGHGRGVTLARVFGWALGLRWLAAILVQWFTQRRGVLCVFPDTVIYWALAGKICRGEPYEIMDWGDIPHFTLRTPGYPLFLAACQLAFGPRVFPARLAQAALGAACVWLAARLTRRAGLDGAVAPGSSWTLPLVAAALVAVDPFVVANSAFLLSEAVFLPLMLLAQWGLAEAWAGGEPGVKSRRGAWALVAGGASAGAILVRPAWALYPPLALLALVVIDRRRWRIAALAAVAIVVVMAPWWVRNARIYGKFVPTALWTGASLYDGLNPRATGGSDMAFLGDPEFWPLDEETQDRVLFGRAVAFARDNPGRALALAVNKAGRFWSPWPNPSSPYSVPVALASAAVTLPPFGLMAVGLWDRRRDAKTLALLASPLAYTFALHVVFVSSMRYRVPAAVPAAGLAALGLRKILEWRAGSRIRA